MHFWMIYNDAYSINDNNDVIAHLGDRICRATFSRTAEQCIAIARIETDHSVADYTPRCFKLERVS
jgi:hypothetical protein